MPFLCQLRGPQAVGGLLSLGLLAKWPERSNCTWKTPWIFVYFSWQYNSPVRAPWLDSAYKKYIINYSFSHPELHTTDIVCVCVCVRKWCILTSLWMDRKQPPLVSFPSIHNTHHSMLGPSLSFTTTDLPLSVKLKMISHSWKSIPQPRLRSSMATSTSAISCGV